METDRLVRWTFRGFWKGDAELQFAETADGVSVEGYEEISIRYLGVLSPVVEKLFLERLPTAGGAE